MANVRPEQLLQELRDSVKAEITLRTQERERALATVRCHRLARGGYSVSIERTELRVDILARVIESLTKTLAEFDEYFCTKCGTYLFDPSDRHSFGDSRSFSDWQYPTQCEADADAIRAASAEMLEAVSA